MDAIPDYQSQDLSPYKIESRREILALLRNICLHQQLVNMQGSNDNAAVVTSILAVDGDDDYVIIDCAQDSKVNQRLVASDSVAFETALEQIRILFFTNEVALCEFEGSTALRFPVPDSVIRLQRREFYRMATPVSVPVTCSVSQTDAESGALRTIKLPLQNVSGGGIAILDEHGLLDATVGKIYQNCKIDLPGGTLVITSLEIRNAIEVALPNGSHGKRLGCLFVDLPHVMLAAIQRYISKLEREKNARAMGRLS